MDPPRHMQRGHACCSFRPRGLPRIEPTQSHARARRRTYENDLEIRRIPKARQNRCSRARTSLTGCPRRGISLQATDSTPNLGHARPGRVTSGFSGHVASYACEAMHPPYLLLAPVPGSFRACAPQSMPGRMGRGVCRSPSPVPAQDCLS